MTEKDRAWTACPAQRVWMSTGAEWTETKETDVLGIDAPELDLSGNK